MRKKITSLALQMGLSLALFSGAALLIFALRGREIQSFVMPKLVEKNFIDIYDELSILELRVKVSRREYNDLPTGLILSQSIAPGNLAQAHDSLRLVVNQPRPLLRMPNLLQSSLDNATAVLERLPANGRVYSLKLAPIGRLRSKQHPHNTIIAQFPPADDRVGPETRVYLLVALRHELSKPARPPHVNPVKEAKNQDTSRLVDPEKQGIRSWVGQNITVAAQYFRIKKIDYRIRHLRPPPEVGQMGQIYKIHKAGNKNSYLLDVYYQLAENRFSSGYELIEIELDEDGACSVKQIPIEQEDPSLTQEQIIFASQKHKEDEKVDILFYRQGAVRIEARCGGEMVYDEEIYPEDLS